MASYEVDTYGATVRRRDPGVVLVLSVVTLGIYNLIWYYRINRELRDFGRVYRNEYLAKEKPWLSVLAVTLGGILIIPAIVSYWRTTARIRRAQEILGEELTNGWVIFACYVSGMLFTLPLLVIPSYVQSGLNLVWDRYPRDDGSAPPELTMPTGSGELPPDTATAEPEQGSESDARWGSGR